MHNLAAFSAYDFERFDEEWFWRDYEHFSICHPAREWFDFKREFERVLAEHTARSDPGTQHG